MNIILKIAILIILFFCQFVCHADDKIDSLRIVYSNPKSLEQKFDVSVLLCRLYKNSNIDSCDFFLERSYEFAKEINAPMQWGWYHLAVSQVALTRSNFNEVTKSSLLAISFFEQINCIEGIIEANIQMGHMASFEMPSVTFLMVSCVLRRTSC